jgi:hypothetical protein
MTSMPTSDWTTGSQAAPPTEEQPLIRPMPQPLMGKLCFLAMVSVAVCGWCILDSWNHDMSTVLFTISEIKNQRIDPVTGQITGDVTHPFNYPLMLAFLQFAFMGIVFTGFWFLLSRHRAADFAAVRENIFNPEWAGLVTTHVFSTFWLQSLMMPATVMPSMMFAASRSLDVPAAALIRSKVIGEGHFGRFGGHPLTTTAMMFGASMLLVFSQTRIAECLCMWSGHGVEMGGIALFLIYGLVLILPAANVVLQESVMMKLDTDPLLMLAVMNVLATVIMVPIVLFAHFSGWENFIAGMTLTFSNQQLYMVAIWLCTQMSLISAVGVAMISMLDSFWAVSLRSFKVVLWWCGKLARVFFFSEVVLSIDKPNASFWGFIMLCGVCLIAAAAAIDSNAKDPMMDAKTESSKV